MLEQMRAERSRIYQEWFRLEKVMESFDIILDYYGSDQPSFLVGVDPGGESTQVEALIKEVDGEPDEIEPELDLGFIVSARAPVARTRRHQIVDAVVELLSEEEPLHREKVLELLQKRDDAPGGEFALETLGSYITQDSRVKKLAKPRGFWALADYEGEETSSGNYRDRVGLDQPYSSRRRVGDAVVRVLTASGNAIRRVDLLRLVKA